MQITMSSKGQIVLPAPMRRRLRLKSRSMLEIEERDGGVFIRPAGSSSAITPIEYPPVGSIKVNRRLLALDKLAGPDIGPEDTDAL